VQSFALSPTEIIPSSEQRKDLNGVNCALIKVQVIDGIDRVEGNIIGDIDSRGTEKRIYLTQGTKFFRLYPHSHLPVSITTSEFDIEKLEGNRVYILRLTGDADEKKAETKKEEKREEPRQQPTEIYQDQSSGYNDSYYQQPSRPAKSRYVSDAEFHFYAGVGFNAISTMGPSILVGASYGMFSLEGGFVYGIDKVEDIHLSISSALSEAYDYTSSKVWASLGVNFDIEQFRISPQAGVAFNMIRGKAVSGTSNTTDYFKDANPMSVFAAVRLSYEVAEHLYVHITPQYDFSIGGDQIYDVIKQGGSKIKAWGEGFGINAGIIYEF
jgi:hypothetical protein